jgi:hypothetical protein
MSIPTPTIVSAIAAVVADIIAVAVAFSVPITTGQQTAILAFVGGASSLVVAAIAWFEGKAVTAQAAIAAGHVTPALAAQAAAKVNR